MITTQKRKLQKNYEVDIITLNTKRLNITKILTKGAGKYTQRLLAISNLTFFIICSINWLRVTITLFSTHEAFDGGGSKGPAVAVVCDGLKLRTKRI